jgi:hypothetical protein
MALVLALLDGYHDVGCGATEREEECSTDRTKVFLDCRSRLSIGG